MSIISVPFAPLILDFLDERAAMTAAMEAARELGLHEFPKGTTLLVISERGKVIAPWCGSIAEKSAPSKHITAAARPTWLPTHQNDDIFPIVI
jgi:hypothetical protein